MARNIVTFDNIPEWAIYALEYGNECGTLTEEDIALINAFVRENFPNGYYMSVKWDNYNAFTTHPAFGKPCGTYEVEFLIEV